MVAGLIHEPLVGRTRLLAAATDHRAAAALAQVLAVTFGPLAVVADEFATVQRTPASANRLRG